ncbi:DUF5011 domain-containing protein [Akkermansiaceae bacterium]|nr:DUF5011 domain-containing protein [Akkermansiaceae bacterium]
MQNSTFEVFKKDENRFSGKCGGILFVLKLILGLFPVLQRRGAFLALFACSFLPLYSDEFVVTTLADDGASGSLRSGIIAANGSSAIDTITFAQGVSGTITLTSDLPAITENLTITGPSVASGAAVTISGDEQHSMFFVKPDNLLNLSALTFTKNADVSKGSIIFLDHAHAVATSITVTDNAGGSANAGGSVGAFYSENTSTLTISHSTFSNNSATIIGSNFGSTPNWTETPSNNRTIVTDSTFESNSGVIFSTERYVMIDRCVFSSNTNTIGDFRGLNAYRVLNSVFTENQHSGYMPLFTFSNWNLGDGWGSFSSNHHLFDGNTFSGNNDENGLSGAALIYVGNTARFGEVTTISNNTFAVDPSIASYGPVLDTLITGPSPNYGTNTIEYPAPQITVKSRYSEDGDGPYGDYNISWSGNSIKIAETFGGSEAWSGELKYIGDGIYVVENATDSSNNNREFSFNSVDSNGVYYELIDHYYALYFYSAADAYDVNLFGSASSAPAVEAGSYLLVNTVSGTNSYDTAMVGFVDSTSPSLKSDDIDNDVGDYGTPQVWSTYGEIYGDYHYEMSALDVNVNDVPVDGYFRMIVSQYGYNSGGGAGDGTGPGPGDGSGGGGLSLVTYNQEQNEPPSPGYLDGLTLNFGVEVFEADTTELNVDPVDLTHQIVLDADQIKDYTIVDFKLNQDKTAVSEVRYNEGTWIQLIDDTPPAAPMLTGPTLTNSPTPTLTGTAEADSTVRIYDGIDNLLGSATAENGSFSIPLSSLLEGSHNITATATDAFDNVSGSSPILTVVVDTIAPAAPTLNGPALTNNPDPTLTGTAEPGSTVRIYHDGSELGSATAESGIYSITVTALLDGSHDITAIAIDGADNESAGTTLTVVVDTTAPVITSGTTGTDLAENSGAGQTVYTIAASDANGVVSYAIGGTDAASLTVNPTIGVVTLNTNPDYEAKNSYSFTVTASDAAGNTSDPTTVTFQITDIDEIPLVIEPGANLAGADLSGADLYGANLSGADLSNANLSDANLYGAALSDANLNGANLNNASLYGANLSNANLNGANLSGANLYGALLSNANLSNANLNGANLYGAVLSDANLTNATVNDVTEISLPGRWIIENNMIVEVEVEPVLVSELPDITATEDGPDVLIDLGPFFKDDNSADDAAMSYAVTENTNGAMVTTSVNTDVFVLKGSYRNGGGYAGEVVVDGNYAYVADGQQGLTVVNVSDPESPTLAGNYNPSWDIGDVAISGGYAYLANQSGGVRVVNIADPSNPTEVAQYDTEGSARGIDVSGDYAYVADGSGLVILDVSNPSAPVLVGTSNTSDFAYRVDVEGGHAYVADRAGGLQIVDISDPSSPQIVGSYSTQAGSNWSTGAAWGVKVEGGYAYMAASGAGLIIVDVSNPANPVLEGSYSTNVSDARGVYVLSGKAYLADGSSGSSGLLVIDVTSPSSPVLVGTYDSMGSGMGVTAVGDYAYLADWGGGLKIVDTTYITDELALSFEPDASGSADITVTATSGADTVSDTFNVTIANVNDAPQFNNGSGGPFGDEWQFTIGEDASVGAVVGTMTATDVDGDTLDYSITDGNEFGLFTIDPSSGEIKVWGVLDYEWATYHSLKVQVADTALSATTWVRVDVSNVPEITLAGDAVVTIEVGGSYTEDSATSDGGETVAATGTVNTNTVDTYTITYSATDNFNNTGTAIRTVNVVDITKPVISLTGDAVVTIEAGTPYQDQGVTVSDNYDTNLTVTIDSSDVNTSVLGSYEVIYSATDGSGNVADEETRTVIVEDNTAPVITLIGDAQVTIEMGGTYTEQGATFLDNHDTELTTTIEDDVDTAVVGSYEVIYSATDDFENNETATRTVIVEDTTAPDAPTLNGPALTKSTTPTLIGTAEPGSTVRIYHDGSELGSATAESGSYSITVSSLSSLSEGSHIITATATDAFNNVSAGTTHEVEVDTTAPEITLSGSAIHVAEAGFQYIDAGATADGQESVSVSSEGTVDTSILGDHVLTYTAEDLAGNVGTATRTVTVEDTTVPEITLIGGEVTIEVDGSYTELGATLLDNYDSSSSLGSSDLYVIDSSAVNTSVVGEYTVTYNVTDSEDNVAQQVTRTVNVVDTTEPVITLVGGDVTIEVGGSYTELGATLLDNYDSSSSLGSSDLYVIDSSDVITSVLGSYGDLQCNG